jgi:hypothetical protein
MTATTSPIHVARRREISPIGALLLTIAGNILVVAIAGLAVAGVAAAAALVFGPQLLSAL